MRLKRILITLCLIFTSIISYSQVLTGEERKLYNIIMQYRKEIGLPDIPLSTSLTCVAQTHVKDLANNKPDIGNCNVHSWSSNGTWTPCCYTPDHAQAKFMWSKPRELKTYEGNGFEIACGSNGCCSDFIMTANYALESWKKVQDTMRYLLIRAFGMIINGMQSELDCSKALQLSGLEMKLIMNKTSP